MPIISGAGSGGSAKGAWVWLSRTTRATDGTIDITGISQAYDDLLVQGVVRGTNATNTDNLLFRLNNDSSATYDYEIAENTAAATFAAAFTTGATSGRVTNFLAAASAGAPAWTSFDLEIFDYANLTGLGLWRVCRCRSNTPFISSVVYVGMSTVDWTANAVNRITLLGNSTAALKTGSYVNVYGRLTH